LVACGGFLTREVQVSDSVAGVVVFSIAGIASLIISGALALSKTVNLTRSGRAIPK
jgi:hypothetical protein